MSCVQYNCHTNYTYIHTPSIIFVLADIIHDPTENTCTTVCACTTAQPVLTHMTVEPLWVCTRHSRYVHVRNYSHSVFAHHVPPVSMCTCTIVSVHTHSNGVYTAHSTLGKRATTRSFYSLLYAVIKSLNTVAITKKRCNSEHV